MNQVKYLTHISKKNEQYEFRFEVPENVTFQFVHPVYTNAESMIDAIGISKNIKKTSTVTKTIVKEIVEIVSERTAKLITMLAKEADMIQSLQHFESVNGWTITIKEN